MLVVAHGSPPRRVLGNTYMPLTGPGPPDKATIDALDTATRDQGLLPTRRQTVSAPAPWHPCPSVAQKLWSGL